MTKEEIEKKINSYTNKKIIIVSLMFIAVFVMLACVIVHIFIKTDLIAYVEIISYFFIVFMIIVAYNFNLNEPLMKTITIDDYKEILKYMSEIPNDISSQKYYDGLLMIKRTLDEMVHYQMDRVDDENFKEHLRYLQSIFLSYNNTSFVSSKVLNKSYLKSISNILLNQIDNGKFNRNELDNAVVEEETIRKKFHITEKMITIPCNAVLIVIMLIKIVVTMNDNLYNIVDSCLVLRMVYNTSADIIAAILATIPLSKILRWYNNSRRRDDNGKN